MTETAKHTINIAECYACGSLHKDIELQVYNNAKEGFTHWFSCPTSGDPVSIFISQGKEGGPVEIDPVLITQLREASRLNRYFVVVCYLDDDPEKPLKKFQGSNNFPIADFDNCIRWVESELRKNGMSPIIANDLPPAGERGPLVNLFQEELPSN